MSSGGSARDGEASAHSQETSLALRAPKKPRDRSVRKYAASIKRSVARTWQADKPSADSAASKRKRPSSAQIPAPLVAVAAPKLEALPFFSRRGYLRLNPDIADGSRSGAAVTRHALEVGCLAATPIFPPEEVARSLAQVSMSAMHAEGFPRIKKDSVTAIRSLDVLVSSHGNVFMAQIAEDLARDFADCGVQVRLLDESADYADRAQCSLVVAPHEFFLLGAGVDWIKPEFVQNAFMYNTEQAQTPWFGRALPFLLASSGVLDLSAVLPPIFREAGVNAHHLEPRIRLGEVELTEEELEHPLAQVIPEHPAKADWDQRPLAVTFLGNESLRRDQTLARLAPRIAEFENFIYYVRRTSPIKDLTLAKLGEFAAARSKVYLNIHRDEFPYFEWHRIVRQGMANDAVVLTDTCLPHPVYRAGTHYVQTEARYLADAIEWILFDPEGQQLGRTVRRNAGRALQSQENDQAARDALDFMAHFALAGTGGR